LGETDLKGKMKMNGQKWKKGNQLTPTDSITWMGYLSKRRTATGKKFSVMFPIREGNTHQLLENIK